MWCAMTARCNRDKRHKNTRPKNEAKQMKLTTKMVLLVAALSTAACTNPNRFGAGSFTDAFDPNASVSTNAGIVAGSASDPTSTAYFQHLATAALTQRAVTCCRKVSHHHVCKLSAMARSAQSKYAVKKHVIQRTVVQSPYWLAA